MGFEFQIQFPRRAAYLDLSFDEGGDVVLVLEDGERLQQVVFQPLPVLRDLFTGGPWGRRRRDGQRSSHSHGALQTFHFWYVLRADANTTDSFKLSKQNDTRAGICGILISDWVLTVVLFLQIIRVKN